MSNISLSKAQFLAEQYVNNLCKKYGYQNKLFTLEPSVKFFVDSYIQGYLFAYHGQLMETLAEKGISLDDLEP